MAINIFKNLFGDKSVKDRKEYQPSIDKTNEFQTQFKNLSDSELRAKTAEFKSLIIERSRTIYILKLWHMVDIISMFYILKVQGLMLCI